jgi:hypothetical protein
MQSEFVLEPKTQIKEYEVKSYSINSSNQSKHFYMVTQDSLSRIYQMYLVQAINTCTHTGQPLFEFFPQVQTLTTDKDSFRVRHHKPTSLTICTLLVSNTLYSRNHINV